MLKAITVIDHLQKQLRGWDSYHSERIVSPCHRLNLSKLNPIALLGKCLVHRIVLKHHQALKQRHPTRHFTPALPLHQWAVSILHTLYLLGLQLLNPPQQTTTRRQLHTYRQGVDEQPHHRLAPAKLRRTARYRGPKQHVVFPTVARKQKRPSPLHQRVKRQPLGPRQPLQTLRHRRRHPPLVLGIVQYLPYTRPYITPNRQRRSGRYPPQRLPPVRLSSTEVLALQPGNVVAIRSRRGQVKLPASTVGGIKVHHLL